MTILENEKIAAPKKVQTLQAEKVLLVTKLIPMYQAELNSNTDPQKVKDLNTEISVREARVTQINELIPQYAEYIQNLNKPYPTGYFWRELTAEERALFPIHYNTVGGLNPRKSAKMIMTYAKVSISQTTSIPLIKDEFDEIDWSKNPLIKKGNVLINFGDEVAPDFYSSINEDEKRFDFEQSGTELAEFEIVYVLGEVFYEEALPMLPSAFAKLVTSGNAIRVNAIEYNGEAKRLNGDVPKVYVLDNQDNGNLVMVSKDNPTFESAAFSVFYFKDGIMIHNKSNSGRNVKVRSTFGTFDEPFAVNKFLGGALTASPASS